MKLETIALIVLCLAGVAWLLVVAIAGLQVLVRFPLLWIVALPGVAIGAYLVLRVVSDRLNSAEDDHYDKIP